MLAELNGWPVLRILRLDTLGCSARRMMCLAAEIAKVAAKKFGLEISYSELDYVTLMFPTLYVLKK